ncbi:hypothetical protein Slin15195_G089120 [Septoria linicola]|uniref:Uncharacterized protein n=1 Tax=Septoria linicola TaxID=215465 RepID=A0A9Q9ENL3_9PEZI|nr:hypothetical protein Slin14017_G091770 [Septoria linicola]USW55593.1 hypothetical protein Slin15195_G089120 [Septoria linicola]
MLETPKTPRLGRNRSRSIGVSEPLATHHIISHTKSNTSTLEIQQKGRTALWANTTKPVIGSSILQITTPKVDGESVIATAKLRSDGCKVMLGDVNSKTKAPWTQISHSQVSDEVTQFVYEGQDYIWRRTQDAESSDSCSGEVPDLELVTSEDSETILAAYLPQQDAVAAGQVGKLDYMQDLGRKLELLCLTAILGVRHTSEMQNKRYSGPRFLADLQQSFLSTKVV